MTINASLDEFQLPAIPSLKNKLGFGTCVQTAHNGGSLTVSEFAEDLALPFTLQGSESVDDDSETTIVKRNCNYTFTDTGSLTLGFASKPGLVVEISTSREENAYNYLNFTSGKFGDGNNDFITECIKIEPGMKVELRSVGPGVEYTNNENETSTVYLWKLSSIEFNGMKLSPMNAECDIFYANNRWLRFDPDNHKGLKILAGTFIKLENSFDHEISWYSVTEDEVFDLSGDIDTKGVDYKVFFNNALVLRAAKINELTPGVRIIGRFHTLCEDINSNTTAIVPSDVQADGTVLLVPYSNKPEDNELDFYNFYNKIVSENTDGVATVPHPLANFFENDILPESVWCLSFKPECIKEDAMCYNKFTNTANDIYLLNESGTIITGSSQTLRELQEDLFTVGKNPLTSTEFTAAAAGSNEASVPNSSSSTTGGHSDANGRRMVSFIGLEDCCGLKNQVLDEVSSAGGDSWAVTFGNGAFGKEYGDPYITVAGGSYSDGANSGSRCRRHDCKASDKDSTISTRGSCRVKTTL